MSDRDPRNVWTDDAIAILRRAHGEHLSFSQITMEINDETGSTFSRNAVIGKACRIGLVAAAPRMRNRVMLSRPPRPPRRIKRKETRERLPTGDLPPDTALLQEIEAQPPPAEFLGIAFLDLQPRHCRYPRGGSNGEPVLFCGQPKRDDSSYCAACHALCHAGHGTMRFVSEDEHQRRSAAAKRLWAARRAAA